MFRQCIRGIKQGEDREVHIGSTETESNVRVQRELETLEQAENWVEIGRIRHKGPRGM